MATGNSRSIDKPIAIILLSGMVVSMVLIVIGVLLFFIRPVHGLHTVMPAMRAIRELPRMQASSWLSLGLFALIVTPVARVIMAIGSFAWVRDWKFVLVSVVVFAAMTAGLLTGKG